MVTDQTSTYKIFEFVSGINEFTRYGRGEQLVDYYDSVGATPPNTINTMKKLRNLFKCVICTNLIQN